MSIIYAKILFCFFRTPTPRFNPLNPRFNPLNPNPSTLQVKNACHTYYSSLCSAQRAV